MQELIQHIVNGITIGAFYALCALGYSLVYGVLKMINFAHGDLSMWGAYLGMTTGVTVLSLVGQANPLLLIPMFVFSMAAVAVAGTIIERFVYRPLRKGSRLVPVISALGVAFVLESTARNVYGPNYQVYPPGVTPSMTWQIFGGVSITLMQVIVLVISIVLMVALYLFIQRSKLGTAIRAVSLDQDTARLMGIDVNQVTRTVFILGPALGAAGAVLLVAYYGSFDFTLGWLFGMKAFTAAIVGGIGNIPGAMLGGMVMGLVEALGAGYISAAYKDVIAYSVLFLILLIRPTGILGERIASKV